MRISDWSSDVCSSDLQDVEVKFNPWHDPEDGRFTFSGRGRYYGAGASVEATGGAGRSGQWQRGVRIDSADPDYSRFDPRNPRNYQVYIVDRKSKRLNSSH